MMQACLPHPQIADLISLIAGTIALIAQVLMYGGLDESIFVKGNPNRHGVRHAIPGPPHMTSVMRLTGCLQYPWTLGPWNP